MNFLEKNRLNKMKKTVMRRGYVYILSEATATYALQNGMLILECRSGTERMIFVLRDITNTSDVYDAIVNSDAAGQPGFKHIIDSGLELIEEAKKGFEHSNYVLLWENLSLEPGSDTLKIGFYVDKFQEFFQAMPGLRIKQNLFEYVIPDDELDIGLEKFAAQEFFDSPLGQQIRYIQIALSESYCGLLLRPEYLAKFFPGQKAVDVGSVFVTCGGYAGMGKNDQGQNLLLSMHSESYVKAISMMFDTGYTGFTTLEKG